jgi:lysyl-tRNA synthetase class 1
MFWADRVVVEALERLKSEKSRGLVIRDEKTASGRVHVGSMRGVAIHGIVSEILSERGIKNTFLYEINDFDAFDRVPAGLDENIFKVYLGKPLFAVPSPSAEAQNYAEYFGSEFEKVIEETGFHPTHLRSSAEYRRGRYNEVIRIALERADLIRDIYKRVSGSVKEGKWLPLMVVCEHCGRVATTRAVSFDSETVRYFCDVEASGAEGCGFKGDISPFDGNAKLPFKVEWAAKFKVFGVHIEGSGKDLSTKGGAGRGGKTNPPRVLER